MACPSEAVGYGQGWLAYLSRLERKNAWWLAGWPAWQEPYRAGCNGRRRIPWGRVLEPMSARGYVRPRVAIGAPVPGSDRKASSGCAVLKHPSTWVSGRGSCLVGRPVGTFGGANRLS